MVSEPQQDQGFWGVPLGGIEDQGSKIPSDFLKKKSPVPEGVLGFPREIRRDPPDPPSGTLSSPKGCGTDERWISFGFPPAGTLGRDAPGGHPDRFSWRLRSQEIHRSSVPGGNRSSYENPRRGFHCADSTAQRSVNVALSKFLKNEEKLTMKHTINPFLSHNSDTQSDIR